MSSQDRIRSAAAPENSPPDARPARKAAALSFPVGMLKTYRWLLLLLSLFVLAAVGFYLWLYQTTGIRHALSNAVYVGVSFAAAAAAYLPARRGRYWTAGLWLLTGSAVSYGLNELSIKGMLPFHLIGGILLILLIGSLVLPRRWAIWLLLSLLYAGGLLLLNQNSPGLRYDASASIPIRTFSIGSVILLGLVFILQLIWFTQRLSLRSRLVFAFILVVLMPTLATTTVAVVLFRSSTERQVIEKLETVAYLKEAEIRSWKQSLEPNLLLAKNRQGPDEQIRMIQALTGAGGTPDYSEQVYQRLKVEFEETITQVGVFDQLFIMDVDGEVLLSTNPGDEGSNHFGRDYFNQGLEVTFITPPSRSLSSGLLQIIAVTPYKDRSGSTLAVLGGQVSLKRLNSLMSERAGLGETGETYLVSPRRVLITPSRYPGFWPQETIIASQAVEIAAIQRIHGYGKYANYRGIESYGVFRWLPDLQLGLVVEQDVREASQALDNMIYASLAASAAALLAAIIAGLLVTHRITSPLNKLGAVAQRIAAGSLNLNAEVEQRDEIGVLAGSFNSMTAQLRYLIGSLEERVLDRTRSLERRTLQLRAAAEVARDASTIHDLQELMDRAVNLLRSRFGFYHAGIFLVDERGEYALLSAAAGEAGKEMLAHGHKLKVGEVGLVGYVTSTGQPRHAHDVGIDAVHFKNPLLPQTRSEVVLPLRTGTKIIGAVDVQSAEPGAFDDETIEVLQTMTDQLAVAIENARLIQQMERTVKELETAYGQYTVESWLKFNQKKHGLHGYRYRGLGPEPLLRSIPGAAALPDNGRVHDQVEKMGEHAEQETITVPVRLRGQTVGQVHFKVRGAGVDEETASMYEDVVSRLAMNLENVRLLEEARLRSEHLHLLQDVTSAAAASIRLDEMMKAVAAKIAAGLGLSSCAFILFDHDKGAGILLADEPGRRGVGEHEPDTPGGTRFAGLDPAFMGQFLSRNKVEASCNVQTDPRLEPLWAFFQKRGTHNAALLPVVTRGEPRGLLVLESADPERIYADDELLLMEQIRIQISSAVDAALLFEQTARRAEREMLTGQIATRIRESLEIQTVLKTAVREVRQALELEEAELLLGGRMYSLHESGPEAGVEFGFLCNHGDMVETAAGKFNRESLSVLQSREKAACGVNLAVPFRIRGREAGLFSLKKQEAAGNWSEEEIRLVEALVDQLGMALESARLYEDSQRRAERERMISEVTNRLRASTNLDTVMQVAIQELAEALQVPRGSIVLKSKNGGRGHE
jgi:GAF domain-containing protein/HAMP domain-containing protein